jgi:hypothetical protein
MARALLEGFLTEGRRQTEGASKEVSAMAVTAGPAVKQARPGAIDVARIFIVVKSARLSEKWCAPAVARRAPPRPVCAGHMRADGMLKRGWGASAGVGGWQRWCRAGPGEPDQVTLQLLQAHVAHWQLAKQLAELMAKAPLGPAGAGAGEELGQCTVWVGMLPTPIVGAVDVL